MTAPVAEVLGFDFERVRVAFQRRDKNAANGTAAKKRNEDDGDDTQSTEDGSGGDPWVVEWRRRLLYGKFKSDARLDVRHAVGCAEAAAPGTMDLFDYGKATWEDVAVAKSAPASTFPSDRKKAGGGGEMGSAKVGATANDCVLLSFSAAVLVALALLVKLHA